MSVQAVGAKQAAVTGAIRTAARATGASFNYLLATAKVESDLDPNLTMRSSTATGLFQFLEQTWLATLKQAGPAFGYGNYAAAITRSPSGRYEVPDPALRREIMELRKDPAANALMGGAFTLQNKAILSQRIGRQPSDGELYIAHFFGPYAGAKAINLRASNPSANAALLFPEPARANRSIFYDRQGNARTIAGVCDELERRYQAARASQAGPAVELAAAPLRPPAPIPNVAAPQPFRAAPSEMVFAPMPAPNALAYADPQPAPGPQSAAPLSGPSAPARGAGGLFHSLFQADAREGPLSPVVTALWGLQPAAPPQDAAAAAPSAPPPAPQAPAAAPLLDLFRDPAPPAATRHDDKV